MPEVIIVFGCYYSYKNWKKEAVALEGNKATI